MGTVFLGLSDTVGEQVEGTGTIPKVKCIISVHTGPPTSPLRVYPEEMMQPERALLTSLTWAVVLWALTLSDPGVPSTLPHLSQPQFPDL